VVGHVVALVMLLASTARAQDFEVAEYSELENLAVTAFGLLQEAPPERQDALRDTAIDRFMAVTTWLDGYIASPAFESLPDEEKANVYRSRYRWEYSTADLLIADDRCQAARDHIRALLDSPINDPELRPRLTRSYEDAIECVNRPRLATLVVEAEPADAQVFVDGALAGLVLAELQIPLGSHRVSVRAPGFISEELEVVAEVEGQRLEVGPVALLAEAPVETGPTGPTWYEWTLWGAGLAAVGTGVYYFLWAEDRQQTLDSPPQGRRVADPEHEEDIVDDLRLVGIVSTSAGVAFALVGTLSFVLRDRGPGGAEVPTTARFELGPVGARFSLQF
jgi:hypothetical protein